MENPLILEMIPLDSHSHRYNLEYVVADPSLWSEHVSTKNGVTRQ